MTECDPCEECIEQAICPRCGEVDNDDDPEYMDHVGCEACGFKPEYDLGRPPPNAVDCTCYEGRLNDEYDPADL